MSLRVQRLLLGVPPILLTIIYQEKGDLDLIIVENQVILGTHAGKSPTDWKLPHPQNDEESLGHHVTICDKLSAYDLCSSALGRVLSIMCLFRIYHFLFFAFFILVHQMIYIYMCVCVSMYSISFNSIRELEPFFLVFTK